MQYVVGFIVIAIIVLIIKYPWYFVGFIAAIVVIIIIYRAIKEMNEEAEREKRIKEREIQAEKKRQAEENNKLELKRALREAESSGKYVCWKCETIEPKRCVDCGLCLSCWENRSQYFSNLCENHGLIEANKIIADAKRKGHNICIKCLTIDPPRCSQPDCTNCLICYGLGGDVCDKCGDDGDD